MLELNKSKNYLENKEVWQEYLKAFPRNNVLFSSATRMFCSNLAREYYPILRRHIFSSEIRVAKEMGLSPLMRAFIYQGVVREFLLENDK